MSHPYDTDAPRKNTNVTVNSDLLRQARELGVNLSRTLEQRLAEIVASHRREEWLEENREALEDFNVRVSERGVFSDGLRRF